MRKYTFVAIMLAAILAVSMLFTRIYVNREQNKAGEEEVVVVTSFYPIYIAAMNLTLGCEDITLFNLSEPQTGCLHDFQLTPEDMKQLSKADLFLVNGGGIESFLQNVAAAYPELVIGQACRDLKLLTEEEVEEEDDGAEEGLHDHEENAHAWMSISCYRTMVQTMAAQLAEAAPEDAETIYANAKVYEEKLAALQTQQKQLLEQAGRKVILFHEAYAYVAQEYGLETLLTVDMDEERQVSAGEIADAIAAIRGGADVILAEELYGRSMAETLMRETDVTVIYLDPLTRGDYEADSYLRGMECNINALAMALQGE